MVGGFSNFINNSGGGTITGEAGIDFGGAGITANAMTAQIDNSSRGHIGSDARIDFEIGGNVAVQNGGTLTLQLLNSDGGLNPSGGGGTIHGNALVQMTAVSLDTGDIVAQIDNRNGGVIDAAAAVNLSLSGDLTTHSALTSDGNATFLILNQLNADTGAAVGGSIGSTASININAANISVPGFFDAEIRNLRGSSAHGVPGRLCRLRKSRSNSSNNIPWSPFTLSVRAS